MAPQTALMGVRLGLRVGFTAGFTVGFTAKIYRWVRRWLAYMVRIVMVFVRPDWRKVPAI
jgi:hypothetical protein